MEPNATVTLKCTNKITLLNVCLGVSVKDIRERSSLLVKIQGSFYTVCSFLPGRMSVYPPRSIIVNLTVEMCRSKITSAI